MTPVLTDTTVDAKLSYGEISGSTGCNQYVGRYTISPDQRLRLGPDLISTRRACPPAIARQEQRYLTLLSLVTAWQRQGEGLLLMDSRSPTPPAICGG